MNQSTCENFANDFLENLLQGNRIACSDITRKYLSLYPSITQLYEEVFKEALYEVGRLWETNKISVATEHIATAITEGILNELFEQLISKTRYNKKVVVACVDNELHQVGIKMVADVFEMKGWETFFLGTGIPNIELVRFIHEIQPDLLAISLSVYFNFTNLLTMLEMVRKEFPELLIIIGGQAFKHVSDELIDRLGNVILLTDLYLLGNFIETYNKHS
ncbi:MAG: cobalamin-dependent protein [Mariniphaga sp.]